MFNSYIFIFNTLDNTTLRGHLFYGSSYYLSNFVIILFSIKYLANDYESFYYSGHNGYIFSKSVVEYLIKSSPLNIGIFY